MSKKRFSGYWRTGVDVYHWWMEGGVLPGQMEFEDYLEED